MQANNDVVSRRGLGMYSEASNLYIPLYNNGVQPNECESTDQPVHYDRPQMAIHKRWIWSCAGQGND